MGVERPARHHAQGGQALGGVGAAGHLEGVAPLDQQHLVGLGRHQGCGQGENTDRISRWKGPNGGYLEGEKAQKEKRKGREEEEEKEKE